MRDTTKAVISPNPPRGFGEIVQRGNMDGYGSPVPSAVEGRVDRTVRSAGFHGQDRTTRCFPEHIRPTLRLRQPPRRRNTNQRSQQGPTFRAPARLESWRECAPLVLNPILRRTSNGPATSTLVAVPFGDGDITGLEINEGKIRPVRWLEDAGGAVGQELEKAVPLRQVLAGVAGAPPKA
jgi:hypothetical protein